MDGAAVTPRLYRLSPSMLLADLPKLATALLQLPGDSAEARSLEAERALLAELEAEALVQPRRRRKSKHSGAFGNAPAGQLTADFEAPSNAQQAEQTEDSPCVRLASETSDEPRQGEQSGGACIQALHTRAALDTTSIVGPSPADMECRPAEPLGGAASSTDRSEPQSFLLPPLDPSAAYPSSWAEATQAQPTASCVGSAAVASMQNGPLQNMVDVAEMQSRIQRAIEARLPAVT